MDTERDTESEDSESPRKRRRGPYDDEEEPRVLVLCASRASKDRELARGVLASIMGWKCASERFADLWPRMDRARYFFVGPELAADEDACAAELQSMRLSCPEFWRGFDVVFFERCPVTGEASALSESAIEHLRTIARPYHYVFIDGLSPEITERVRRCRFRVWDDGGGSASYTLREWLAGYNYEFLAFGAARDSFGAKHNVTAARSLL